MTSSVRPVTHMAPVRGRWLDRVSATTDHQAADGTTPRAAAAGLDADAYSPARWCSLWR
jgi:hypothetical protein